MTGGGRNSAIALIIKVFAPQYGASVDYFPQSPPLPIGELRNLYNRCNGSRLRVNPGRINVAGRPTTGRTAARRDCVGGLFIAGQIRVPGSASCRGHRAVGRALNRFGLPADHGPTARGSPASNQQPPCWFALPTPNMVPRELLCPESKLGARRPPPRRGRAALLPGARFRRHFPTLRCWRALQQCN